MIDNPLITKLRNLNSLQNNPDLVEAVINDLMYWYFIREKRRPRALFRMMILSESRWRLALGIPNPKEEEEEVKRLTEEYFETRKPPEVVWHYHKEVDSDGRSVTYCGRSGDVAVVVKSVDEDWAKVCKKCRDAMEA